MDGIAMIGLWVVWSVAIVCLFLCFLLGWVITGWSGVQIYGFDSGDWKQWIGFYAATLSAAGWPLLVGLPAAILIDGASHLRRSAQIRKDANAD